MPNRPAARTATSRIATGKRPGNVQPDTAPFIELRSFLAYRLSTLAYHVTKTLAVTYSQAQQLTPSEWKVLSILAETEGLNATEVSLRSTLDRFAVSKTIGRLINRGLIARHRAQTTGRTMLLSLTTDGWETYRPIARQAMNQQRQLLAALTAGEQETFFALIDKLDARLGQTHASPRLE
jgi:DNA-binding MarR family transcriptional regulator